jgi:hypothetical protein
MIILFVSRQGPDRLAEVFHFRDDALKGLR